MAMKRFIILFLFLFYCFYAFSQEPAKNTIYLEAGGATLVGSLNYERLFLLKNTDYALSLRGGFTYIPFLFPGEQKIIGLPIGSSFIVRGKKICFEAGTAISANMLTLNPAFENTDAYRKDIILIFGLRMGVRHQPGNSGIFWNVLLQPTFGGSKTLKTRIGGFRRSFIISYLPWISLGIGYSF